jgi:hypothetical protein
MMLQFFSSTLVEAKKKSRGFHAIGGEYFKGPREMKLFRRNLKQNI